MNGSTNGQQNISSKEANDGILNTKNVNKIKNTCKLMRPVACPTMFTGRGCKHLVNNNDKIINR